MKTQPRITRSGSAATEWSSSSSSSSYSKIPRIEDEEENEDEHENLRKMRGFCVIAARITRMRPSIVMSSGVETSLDCNSDPMACETNDEARMTNDEGITKFECRYVKRMTKSE